MTGDSEKAQRYISALDTARCQDRWDEVPELIRKVTKHAPHKTYYLEVARAESKVAAHDKERPSTAQSSSFNLHELVPSLLSIVEKPDASPQEILQTQACLGWIHYTLNEAGIAASRLPNDFGETVNSISDNGQEPSSWTRVCLVKGCYFKSAGLSADSKPNDALEAISSLTPWLSSHSQTFSSTPQFSYWTEKLLGKSAQLTGDQICANTVVVDDKLMGTALTSFRLWSAHPVAKQPSSSQGQKLATWKSYYDSLTAILQHGLPYVPATSEPERPQLASELRRVESIYEANLLQSVMFPTANSTNSQVEEWVEQIIANWEVLCGGHWRDEDLGEGGQSAVSRNVLDILYRAATKTYHSHLILRRLFHVHSAVAEFDLALKALDSYIEIVISAKERAEKAAESGELEDDSTLLRTLSEGVSMLCCFGSEREAEKAKDLVALIQKVVDRHAQESASGQGSDQQPAGQKTNPPYSGDVPPAVLAMAYRAIGVGLANWAYWTPINEARDDIRAEAIEYLERSIAPELEDELNYSSLYTLALVLAEDRDLDGAIDYVKSALTSNTHPTNQADLARARDLVSLWHLLALLLSAKHDFAMAERSCETAFEQFPTAVTSHDKRSQKQHLDVQLDASDLKHALVDQLRGREKERIIETRVTQLAFVEIMEGPEAAVNHSHQLLSLFATLFQNLELEGEGSSKNVKTNQTDHLIPPKSSAGTVKTFRGSIFSRNRVSRLPERRLESGGDHTTNGAREQPHGAEGAPSIQVTDEDTNPPDSSGQGVGKSDSVKQKFRRRASSVKKPENLPKHDFMANGEGIPEASDIGTAQQTQKEANHQHTVGIAVSEAVPSSDQSAKQPLWPIAHNMKHTHQPYPSGHPKQPPEQDVRLPTSYRFDSPTSAVTRFPISQAQKHALGVLVKIWLLIAGLYRRASLFDDAQEACEEASKQLSRIDALVAAQNASAKSFSNRGWGVSRSSEELWADLQAEQAYLSIAQSRPHEAIEQFETALMRDPDHPRATIGLANLLLDIWDQTMPAETPQSEVTYDASTLSFLPSSKQNSQSDSARLLGVTEPHKPQDLKSASLSPDEEPKFLNRLAARDRAYGLLSTLTKRGSSWDNSEAWYALSRAYEAGGQIEKLKEVLWWCIELEDRRPIRHWSNIGSGLYVL